MNADERRWLTVERRHCPGRFRGRYDAFISCRTLWNIPKSFEQQNGTELLLGSTANFNRAAPGSDPVKVGAFHCAELVYVFATQQTVDRPWEATDRQLSDVMSSYWVRFAATGNPNGPDLPEWPAYDEQSRHVREFGSRVSVGPGPKTTPLFEAYLSTRLPPVRQ